MLRDSTVVIAVVAVVRTRPRAIPLPMIALRKSIHGFLFPYTVMGLRFGPPELRYHQNFNFREKKNSQVMKDIDKDWQSRRKLFNVTLKLRLVYVNYNFECFLWLDNFLNVIGGL